MTPDPAPAAPPWLHRAGRRAFAALGHAALVAALWLALIKFPNPPAFSLDPSWQMALSYAVEHALQFGRDIIFTYGPLGYLLASINTGSHYGDHLVWQFGANLVFALTIWQLGRSFRGWRQGLYYVYFFAFGIAYLDALHMIMILVFGLALTREPVITRRWLSALIAGALGILALVKFTNLMLGGFVVLCAVALHAWRRRWLDAALAAGAFALAAAGGWVAWHQALGNLPAYVYNSLSLSSGYVESMGLDESAGMFRLGLTAGLTLGAYYLLTLYRAKDFPRALAVVLMAAAASFLNWKHGFVRADGHVLAHFFVSLLIVVTFPVLLEDDGPLRWLKGALLTLCAACCLAGIWLNTPVTIIYAASTVNSRIMDTVNSLAIVRDLARNARDAFAAARQNYALPGIKALVGDGSVDILGNEQAYAFFNDLHYTPRPALQSYATYNERLVRLDGNFIKSDRAPLFYLQKVNGDTIDDRMPSLDDALATLYLYHHYTYLMEEREFLTWKRQPPDPALDARTPLTTATVKFGQTFPAPDLGDTPVWCELEVRPSLLGRLRTWLYKPPLLQLGVTDGGGNKKSFRLVRGQALAGFLVYPHFTSNYNITKFEEGGPGPRIARLAVELAPALQKYYAPEIEARFYSLPPFPRSMQGGAEPLEVKYRAFSQPPVNVNAPFPPQIMMEGGHEVLLAHPPSALTFQPGENVRHVSGRFGLVSRAYTDGNTTDGAEFIIEWIDAQGRVTRMFYRHLQPLTIPADRGDQSFDFRTPAPGGQLVFRTTPGPANNIAFDWTYWSGVKFE